MKAKSSRTWSAADVLDRERVKSLCRLVETAATRLLHRRQGGGGRHAKRPIVDGVAHEQILRGARRAKADMIVRGAHGRTGLARFFLGSVAGGAASMASCPGLTVRGTFR